MKKIYISIYALIFCCFFTGSIYSTERAIRNYDFKDFNKIVVSNGILLNITQSSSYSIEANADEKDFEHLKVEQDGNTVKIYIDKNNYRKNGDIKIDIKMPSLTGLDLSGGSLGNMTMDINDDFSCEMSGGARISGKLNCKNLNMEISGGSIADLNGKGGIFTADASGGSVYHFKEFNVKDVNAELSGGSRLEINSEGTVNVDASGGSKVIYYGSANVGNTDFSGGSGISRGQ